MHAACCRADPANLPRRQQAPPASVIVESLSFRKKLPQVTEAPKRVASGAVSLSSSCNGTATPSSQEARALLQSAGLPAGPGRSLSTWCLGHRAESQPSHCHSLGPDSFSSQHTKERTEGKQVPLAGSRLAETPAPGKVRGQAVRDQPRLLRPWPAGEESTPSST